ncbi:hypothetical protein TWF696_007440 [Orbilia brochopaga]|uniref:Indole-diterpene biosynthesis protein PaxU n=1 Tax=Orbilia brochopaga TaxID=3140254 RepID=A0AAV9UK82_9PEZI
MMPDTRQMASSGGLSLASLGFKMLTPLLFYSDIDPGPTTRGRPSISPDGIRYDLILIWGWMNASPRHLVKYIQLHRSLQPGVPILFASSTTTSWLGITGNLHRSLPLIYDVVKGLPEDPRIFVHAFSNGGAGSFAEFLTLYRRNEGNAFPVSAMLMDSAPGDSKFPSALTRAAYAFLEAVHNSTLRTILFPLVYLAIFLTYLPSMLLGLENPIGKLKRILNDETFVSEGGVRGYIYCKGDIMVGWENVVEHADQASERGWNVLQAGFDGGNHVGCYRYHPDEYINFVLQLRSIGASSTAASR